MNQVFSNWPRAPGSPEVLEAQPVRRFLKARSLQTLPVPAFLRARYRGRLSDEPGSQIRPAVSGVQVYAPAACRQQGISISV